MEVRTDWGTVRGTLVPRYASSRPSHIVLKLPSGYNVGLDLERLRGARVVSKGEKPGFSAPPPPKSRKGLPRVLVLGTGGTIASRVDYRTGAVHPAVSAGDLHSLIPEISEIASITPEILFNVFSENIRPSHWSKLALRVKKAVAEGFAGVVITHGTDTLGYTAAALGFALSGVPIPVLLVGAQRSSDRPSSDSALNLVAAVSVAATSEFTGVYVAMHLDDSDERVAIHRATRVRKNHTSRRDAFASIGVPLAAVWTRSGLEQVLQGLPPRGQKGRFVPRTRFEEAVVLLKFYPSMPPSMVTSVAASKTRGLILEGTGLGHVNSEVVSAVRSLVRKGVFVGMASQCVNGRVNLNVYDTGRDLTRAGVVPLEDMLAETALVKAMWALGNAKSPAEASGWMTENLEGEITSRSLD